MGKKKVLLVIAFVVIAMVLGGIVSIYEMNKGSVEAKGSAQAEIIDKVQPDNRKTSQAEIKSEVQADKMAFSCGISGCTQTEVHHHGLCGIDGCTQIGEHSHGGNGVGHHQSGHGGGHH